MGNDALGLYGSWIRYEEEGIRMKTLLTTVTVLALMGPVYAETFDLTIDHCTGGCSDGTTPFGTVTVTQDGSDLDFLVKLNGIYKFQKSTAFDAFAFGFTDGPVTVVNLTSGFTSDPIPTKQDGFGLFAQGIKADATGAQQLSFKVLNDQLGNITVSTNPPGDTIVAFAADIQGWEDHTGNVGGGNVTPGVPEPATWGMLLLGFVGLGFAFRQRRRATSLA
jgi:hypothetical protein